MPETGHTQQLDSMEAVAAALPSKGKVHLALPSSALFFERIRLPSTDRDELLGMMQLQLEKTLPYPPETVTSDLIVTESSETESVIMAIALSNSYLDSLSAPLREIGRLPDKITVYPLHIASVASKIGIDLLIYREDAHAVALICENGKIGFLQILPGFEPLPYELSQLLLGAELEGVPVIFNKIHLDAESLRYQADLTELLGSSTQIVLLETPKEESTLNLIPASWLNALAAANQMARIKSRLMMAGAVYLFILLCAAGFLTWMNSRVAGLDHQLRAITPEVSSIKTRSARWNALAPAIDPSHYTVELLYQIQKSMPSDGIWITQFDQGENQFVIEGEAPTAGAMVQYGEQLKANPELKDFSFEEPTSTLLPNEHAQFRIFGKL